MNSYRPTTLEMMQGREAAPSEAQASEAAPSAGQGAPARSTPEWLKLAVSLAMPWLLLALLIWLLTKLPSVAGGSGFVEGLGKAKVAAVAGGGFVEGLGAG